MAEPAGLGMSLDDLITKQQRGIEGGGGFGKQQRSGARRQQGRGAGVGTTGGRTGGRGGRRGGRGGGGGGGGGDQMQMHMEEDWSAAPPRRQQQQHQHQVQHQMPILLFRQQGQGGQQQQQQQRGRHDMRQRDPLAYREEQKCYQKDTGEVVFRFKTTDMVRVDPSGNITLTSGGYHNSVTLASLNDALNLIGIRVTCPSGDVLSGDWSISDGRTLTRFADGVVLPAKGAQHAGRGRQLLQAFNNPHHAQQAAAAAASNAAATAAGVLPFMGLVPPGIPAARMKFIAPAAAMLGGGAGNGGAGAGAHRPSVFARLGGQQEEQQQRFAPY